MLSEHPGDRVLGCLRDPLVWQNLVKCSGRDVEGAEGWRGTKKLDCVAIACMSQPLVAR